MAGLKRRILGITVISVGVCAALPFRNAPADKGEAVGALHAPASQNELTLQLKMPSSADADSVIFTQPFASIALTRPAPRPQEVRRDELQAPPSIAAAFQPLIATIPVATFPVATAEATPLPRRTQPAQRHRIAEGDTLEALAERYFGNCDQWRSIWEANSGLLTAPNILPIGQELLIPQIRPPSRNNDDDCLVPIPLGLLSQEE